MTKILVNDNVIVGYTVDDDYPGDAVEAPDGFSPADLSLYDLVDGAAVLNVERSLSAKRQAMIKALNRAYATAMAALRADYPEAETLTWTLQVSEAKARQAWLDAGSEGDAPPTPFIAALSAARDAAGVGDGLDDLVARILRNDAAYTPAVASITAARHAAELEIKTAPNAEALAAVTWDILP